MKYISRFRRGVFVIVLLLSFSVVQAMDVSELLAMQQNMESKLQKVMDEFLGKNKSLVNIQITLKETQIKKTVVSEEKNIKSNKASNDQSDENALPGYSILNPQQKLYDSVVEASKSLYETIPQKEISKIEVVLIVDNSVTAKQIATVKYLARSVLKIYPNVVNHISIDLIQPAKEQAAITKEKTVESFPVRFANTLKSPELIKFYITVALLTVLAIVFIFILFILSLVYLRRKQADKQESVIQQQIITKKDEGLDEAEDLFTLKPSVPTGPTQIIQQKQIVDADGRAEPGLFSFVDENNLYKINYLIKDESNEKKIAVLNFLNPELGAALFEMFPLKTQKELILAFHNEVILSPKEVRNFSNEVQSQIEFLAGGFDFTLSMFDCLSNAASENVLKEVEKANPKLANKISQNIFVFEDIQYIDKRYIQSIVKQIGVKDFSVAIYDTSDQFKEKIYDALSEGMVDLIKQSMQLLRKQPASKVSSIQHSLVQALRTLNQEGLIPSKGELKTS